MQFSHLDGGCVQTVIFWVPRQHVSLYIDSTVSWEVSTSIFIVYVTSTPTWRQLSLPRKHNMNIIFVWRIGQNFRLGLLRRMDDKISYGSTWTLNFAQIMRRLCRKHYVFLFSASRKMLSWREYTNGLRWNNKHGFIYNFSIYVIAKLEWGRAALWLHMPIISRIVLIIKVSLCAL